MLFILDDTVIKFCIYFAGNLPIIDVVDGSYTVTLLIGRCYMSSLMRILFVEDKQEIRDGMEFALNRLEILLDPYRANNKPELENILSSISFDIIILSSSLENITVQETISLRNKLCPKIPMIVASNEDSDDLKLECLDLGVSAFTVVENYEKLADDVTSIVMKALENEENGEDVPVKDGEISIDELSPDEDSEDIVEEEVPAEEPDSHDPDMDFTAEAPVEDDVEPVSSMIENETTDTEFENTLDRGKMDEVKIDEALSGVFIEDPVSLDELKSSGKSGLETGSSGHQSFELNNPLWNSSRDFIFLRDHAGRIFDANEFTLNKFDCSKEEIIQMNPAEIEGQLDAGQYKKRFEKLSENGEVKYETAYLLPNDKKVQVDVILTKVENSGNDIVLSIARDISERKETSRGRDKMLNDYSKRIRELNCLFNIGKIFEKGGRVERIMQSVVRLVPSAWLYPNIASARIAFDKREFRSNNFKTSPWKLQSEIRSGDNIIGSIEVYYSEQRPDKHEGPFLKNERSLLNTIAEQLSNYINRIRAEAELRIGEERYRSLFENHGEAIFILDTKSRFIAANRAAETIFKVEKGSLKGRNLSDFISREMSDSLNESLKAWKVGEKIRMEVDAILDDESTSPIMLTVSPRNAPDGKIIGVFGSFHVVVPR